MSPEVVTFQDVIEKEPVCRFEITELIARSYVYFEAEFPGGQRTDVDECHEYTLYVRGEFFFDRVIGNDEEVDGGIITTRVCEVLEVPRHWPDVADDDGDFHWLKGEPVTLSLDWCRNYGWQGDPPHQQLAPLVP
jgi:hypothetical protein